MAITNVPGNTTWINENVPTANYAYGAEARLGDAIDTAVREAHMLLHFNVAAYIPAGALIHQVVLWMYLSSKDWAGVSSATTYVRRMARLYDSDTASWNIAYGSNPWTTPGANSPYDADANATTSWTRYSSTGVPVWETHDLGGNGVADAQGWLDGTLANYGYKITGAAPGTASQKNAHIYKTENYGDGSLGPFLQVYYTPDSAPVVDEDCTYSELTSTSVKVGATISSDGGDPLTARKIYLYDGVAWYEHSFGAGPIGYIEWTFTGMTPGRTFTAYVQAWNDAGTDGSNAVSDTFPAVTSNSGDGGSGIASEIEGESKRYAGGGGGFHTNSALRGLGTDGGGHGGYENVDGIAGTANTGGGGGGAKQGGSGATGGKGIAVVKYLIADAVSATPALANDIFKPSLAYHNGKLWAPYADPDGVMTVDIASVGTGTDAVINTSTDHGLQVGQIIMVSGTSVTTNPAGGINGVCVVKAITDANTFTLERQAVSVEDGTGQLSYNHDVGYAHTGEGYSDAYIRTSRSSFHTGSLKKDFRYISIIHEPIPATCALKAAYTIDDVRYPTSVMVNGLETAWYDVTAVSAKESRLALSREGFEFDMELALQGANESIVIRGFNVVWNFIKIPKHLYSLDLRAGAGSGRWDENPEEAIRFLFEVADNEATFEDRYSGEYRGTIEEVEYTQSNFSLAEGPSGFAKILVREST